MTDFSTQLHQLNLLNETKGQELTVLSQLPKFRLQAETEQEWEMVAESWWQECLCHKHFVINNQDPDKNHLHAIESTALTAHEVVTKHHLDHRIGDSHLFVGEAYRYNRQYQKAEKEFLLAQEFFIKNHDVRLLEVQGKLAETFIRLGQTTKGLDLAYQTYDSYDTDPIALTLKKADEYRFIVWRTGIFSRLQVALDEINAEYDKVKLKSYLEKSIAMLINNEKFAYRITEIKNSLSKL